MRTFIHMLMLLLLAGCATGPAKQQKFSTTSDTRVHAPPDQIDQTHHITTNTSHSPDTLITFMCIVGCVIVLTVVCMWWHTRDADQSDSQPPQHPQQAPDHEQHSELVEQDFLGAHDHTPPDK